MAIACGGMGTCGELAHDVIKDASVAISALLERGVPRGESNVARLERGEVGAAVDRDVLVPGIASKKVTLALSRSL